VSRGLLSDVLLGAALMSSVGACSEDIGHKFVRPAANQLVFGETTEQQVIDLEGAPTRLQLVSSHKLLQKKPFPIADIDGPESLLNYRFSTNPIGAPQTQEWAAYVFVRHRLCEWNFESDEPALSTDFDLGRARALHRGMSRDDVRALMGEPTGRGVYPCVPQAGSEHWIYDYTRTTIWRTVSRTADILFDSSGRIADLRIYAHDTAS